MVHGICVIVLAREHGITVWVTAQACTVHAVTAEGDTPCSVLIIFSNVIQVQILLPSPSSLSPVTEFTNDPYTHVL